MTKRVSGTSLSIHPVIRNGEVKCESNTRYREFISQQFGYANIELESPGRSFVVLDNEREIAGHFSIWYGDTPVLNNLKVGYIGHYFARYNEAAALALLVAQEQLRLQKCGMAVGPVDGNTWRRYRLVTASSSAQPFFLEPTNPTAYVTQFEQSGFDALATYSSSIQASNPRLLDNLMAMQKNANANPILAVPNVKLRAINLGNSRAELHTMFDIACDAFKNNFLYTAISRHEFVARYERLLPVIDSELVLIAEKDDKPVGFILSVPDLNEPSQKERALVIKTVARIAEIDLRGIGMLMTAELHKRAYSKGFQKVVHALYKDDNRSSNYSIARDIETIRKYAVFGKKL